MARRPKALVRTGAPQPPDVIGERATAVRDELLEIAGWDKPKQAVAVAQSLQRLTDELDARVIERIPIRKGRDIEVIEEFIDIDHGRRHAAAHELLSVLAVQPSRNAGVHGPTAIQVNITLRPMDDDVIEADVVQVPAE